MKYKLIINQNDIYKFLFYRQLHFVFLKDKKKSE